LGTHAIVETAQGLEFGELVIANRKVPEDQIVAPLRPVIREATKEDEAHHEDNRRRQHEAFKICLTKIADHGLDMKLVDSQYTFDNTKLIFFFTSAGRVDFRALVKDLASVFRTRIELRQIGIRDEARMIGGFGVCGRKLCCAGFLPNFVQVSIKMAKEQGLSINAAKISGTCGRLMCCLRYEQDAYERELALMPPVDSFVETPDGKGTVIDLFPISGKVKVKLSGDQDIVPKIYHMSALRVLKRAEKKHSDDTEGNE
jgi:cell fate regulator YaaT (PSP1 superfamily)